MASIPPNYEAAFIRWGYLADREAKKYGLPNGATLLAKIGYIESRYSKNMKITSYAGAQGPMQFMPETRAEWIRRYGLDPWKSVDEAVHSAGIFMKTLGLDSYNPGSSTYIDEVLQAPVSIGADKVAAGPAQLLTGARERVGSTAAAAKGAATSSTDSGESFLRFLVTVAIGLGGAALVGIGVGRAAGSAPAAGPG